MPYFGTEPVVGIASTTKQQFSGDASAVAFTMLRAAALSTDLEVFVDNVQQEPTVAYAVSGTTLTFTAAPATGTNNIYVIHRHSGVTSTVIENLATTLAMKSDGAVITMGANDEVSITHVHNEGIILNGSYQTSSAGTSNFRAGVNAGNSIASGGNYNVVIGDEAGTALTTGDNNVAIGFEALKTEDANGDNVAVGYQALKVLNAGADGFNTAVGYLAGTAMTTGLRNTLIGAAAGDVITTADDNIAIGHNALGGNILGSNNVAVGKDALEEMNPSSAADMLNTAVGFSAGQKVTTGIQNTLIGGVAGDALTVGSTNVAIGVSALGGDTKGNSSVAIGSSALRLQNFTSATDVYNVAIGRAAGENVTTGVQNTLIGGLAGDALTDADFNVAIGTDALTADTLGSRSVAIGRRSLYTQNFTSATDSYNIGVGFNAGYSITTGKQNTFIGGLACDEHVNGENNVAIGYDIETSATGVSNEIIIGTGFTGSGANTFSFGKGSNVVSNNFSSNASFSRSSDERLKTNISADSLGLDFINDLRTVKYKWKSSQSLDANDAQLSKLYNASENAMDTDSVMHGLIAQEVKSALDTAGVSTFGGWDENPDGVQQISREMFVIPLIKAVQELSTSLDAALARIATLEG